MFASVDAQRCTVAAAYSIAGLCCFNAVPDKYGFFIVFVPELVYHKNNMIRDELVPFADKIVSDKAQEIVKSLGYPMIGFDSEGT